MAHEPQVSHQQHHLLTLFKKRFPVWVSGVMFRKLVLTLWLAPRKMWKMLLCCIMGWARRASRRTASSPAATPAVRLQHFFFFSASVFALDGALLQTRRSFTRRVCARVQSLNGSIFLFLRNYVTQRPVLRAKLNSDQSRNIPLSSSRLFLSCWENGPWRFWCRG